MIITKAVPEEKQTILVNRGVIDVINNLCISVLVVVVLDNYKITKFLAISVGTPFVENSSFFNINPGFVAVNV